MADESFLDWAVAGRPMAGETASGDLATVETSAGRCVLAVVDGLGHGPEAAAAASTVVRVVEGNRAEPVEALLLLAHEALAESRGAAATVASIDGESGRLDWLGVGNVNGVVQRADGTARPRTHGVFLCRGVLGYVLPHLHVGDPLQLDHGDHIVIATDGVRGDLTAALRPDVPVWRLAETILAGQASADDDALVFVARYRAPDPAGRTPLD